MNNFLMAVRVNKLLIISFMYWIVYTYYWKLLRRKREEYL